MEKDEMKSGDDVELKLGDVVVLKSNPEIKMTIETIQLFDITGIVKVHCSWFAAGLLQRNSFPIHALEQRIT